MTDKEPRITMRDIDLLTELLTKRASALLPGSVEYDAFENEVAMQLASHHWHIARSAELRATDSQEIRQAIRRQDAASRTMDTLRETRKAKMADPRYDQELEFWDKAYWDLVYTIDRGDSNPTGHAGATGILVMIRQATHKS